SCSAWDTIQINALPISPIAPDLGNDTVMCTGIYFTMDANAGASNYTWSTGGTNQMDSVLFPGTYWVEARQGGLCPQRDSIVLTAAPAALKPNLGADTIVCGGQPFALDAGAGYSSYLWSTGASTQTATASSTANYWVEVTDASTCPTRDTIYVDFGIGAQPNLGQDWVLCPGNSFYISPGVFAQSYLWSTGATAAAITVNAPGIYWLDATDINGCTQRDSLQLFAPSQFSLGPDTSLCPGDVLTITAGAGGTSYQWNTSANTQSINVTLTGQYYVTMNGIGGCQSSDTINVFFATTPPNLGPDVTLCAGTSFPLDAGPGYSNYTWSTGATTQSINITTSGLYWVDVTAGSGCTLRDSILVLYYPPMQAGLGIDQFICAQNDTIILNPGAGFSSYTWSSGAITPLDTVYTSGIYYVDVVDPNGCPSSDTIEIFATPPIGLNLGADTTVCPGDSVVLDAGPGHQFQLWSDFTIAQTLTVSTPGQYHVFVGDATGCTERDTIELFNAPPISVTLGPDTAICPDTSLILDPGPGFSTYLWSDNSTAQTLTISTAGTYWVEVTDANGCSARDTLLLGILPDCVWPGDADHDGTADNADLLAIGVAFGASGPARPAATTNWYGQPCPNWAQSFPSSVNYKHADSDGSGTVDDDDTLAVYTNYALTHNRTGGTGGGVPLFLMADQDTVLGNDVISLGLYFGEAQSPVDTAYGLAVSVSFDPAQIVAGSFGVSFAPSFLGTKGQDLLTLAKDFSSQGKVDLALVRNDQTDVGGQGRIATLYFRADSSYWAGQGFSPVAFGLNDVVAIRSDYSLLNLGLVGDTVIIEDVANGLAPENADLIQLYPNPVQDVLWLEIEGGMLGPVDVRVFDLPGRILQTHRFEGHGGLLKRQISTGTLPEGVYLIEIVTPNGRDVRKVEVIR
ncbi:MAG: T9SS type A sorting domain-containing protein, partial [Bacteroidota bacterium]